MGILITSANFTGKFAIPQSAFSDLDGFIDELEESYILELLGADLYADFKGNLVNKVPTAANYLAIYNKFAKDFEYCLYQSKGMVEMLCGFVWFEFMRDVKYKSTTQGVVVNSPDTSQLTDYSKLFSYYNDAVRIYQTIQAYICYIQPQDYTAIKFNGQAKDITISMFQ